MPDPLAEAKKVAEAATPGTRRRDGTIWSEAGTQVDIRIGGDEDYDDWITIKTRNAEVDAAFAELCDRETVIALLDAVQAAKTHHPFRGCGCPLSDRIARVEALLSSKGGEDEQVCPDCDDPMPSGLLHKCQPETGGDPDAPYNPVA